MVIQTKLTLALLATLLGWSSPTPPDFWVGIGHPEEREFHADLRASAVALDTNDAARAAEAARRATSRLPDRFEGHLLLALALEARADPAAATHFARALALESRWASHPVAADYASAAFVRARDFVHAAELACAAARAVEPSELRALLFARCGAALMAAGPDTLDAARRALELGEPPRPNAAYIVLLALAFDRGGAHEHALVLVRPIASRALEDQAHDDIEGDDADRLTARALLLEAAGRTRDAALAYERAAATDAPWRSHAQAAADRLRAPQPSAPTPPRTRGRR